MQDTEEHGEPLPDHAYAALAVKDNSTIRSLSLRQAVAELIIEGRWVPGRSAHELSNQFMVSESTVSTAKGEVLRLMRMDLGSPEDLRMQMVANITRIVAKAEEDREFGAAVAALRLQADVLGLSMKTNERLIIIERHTRQLGNLTVDELEAEMERLKGELRIIDVPSSDSGNGV